MESGKITYKTNTATEQQILEHLKECDNNFLPPLSQRVALQAYSKKIKEFAITFEAWSENILVGLVAAYTNATEQSAFITNVSILKRFMGLSIAAKLTSNCIDYVKQNNFKEIKLEVHKNNTNAIGLYKKINFMQYDTKDDLYLMKLEIK